MATEDDVAAFLPPEITAAGVTLDLSGDGAGRPGRRSVTWRAGSCSGEAVVEVRATSRSTTDIDVGLDGQRDTAVTEVLAEALARCLRPAPAPTPAPTPTPMPVRPRPRRAAVVVVPLAGVVILGLLATQLLAPPDPLLVDDAVAAFRALQTEPPAPAGSSPPTLPSDVARERVRPSPTRRAARATGPRSDEPTGGGDAAGSPPDHPAGTVGERPAATRAAPARRPAQDREGPRAPEPGVYTFATSGYEEIDRPQSRHDYPDRTPLIVRRTECGFALRWQPYDDRFDEMELCSDGELPTLRQLATRREFYGQSEHTTYRCRPGSIAYRTEPGARWQTRCDDGETTITTAGEVVGLQRLDVGGESVKTVHLRLRSTLAGATSGTWTADRWIDPRTGLLVRIHTVTDARSSSGLGGVNYHEDATSMLRSLTPRR